MQSMRPMASVGAVNAAQRPSLGALIRPADQRSAQVPRVDVSVVDAISNAGRAAATRKARVLQQLAQYATGPVTPTIDLTAPLNLDQRHKTLSSAYKVIPERLTGMVIERRAEAMRADDGVNRVVQSGRNPLGPGWNEGPPHMQRERRPDKKTLDAAKRMRESGNGLSASIARGQGMLKAGSIKDLNTESLRKAMAGPTTKNAPG